MMEIIGIKISKFPEIHNNDKIRKKINVKNMTYYGSLRSLASLRFAPFRSFTSLAGFCMGDYRDFKSEKTLLPLL